MKSHVTVYVLKIVSVWLMFSTVVLYLMASYRVYFMELEYDSKIMWLIAVLGCGILGITLECMVYAFAHLVDVVDRTSRFLLASYVGFAKAQRLAKLARAESNAKIFVKENESCLEGE